MNKLNDFFMAAKKICDSNGFDAIAVTALAHLETGGFEKIIGKNNYFGLKIPEKSVWTGKTAEKITNEYLKQNENENEIEAKSRAALVFRKRIIKIQASEIAGKKFWHVWLVSLFRDWDTLEEAIDSWCDFIFKNYKNAYINRANAQEFFNGLINGRNKYATDPLYAEKSMQRYKYLKTIIL